MTIYTTTQAAVLLGLSPVRVRALAANRRLGHKFGAQWAFTAAEIDALRVRKPGRPVRRPPLGEARHHAG